MSYYVELPGTGTIIETDDLSNWPEAKRLSKAEGKRRLKEEALRDLRKILKPGDTVHTVLRHVSASGMSRRIDLYKLVKGDRVYLTTLAARAMGDKVSDKGGIIVSGCGMDMGFHLVYNLGATIWPKGTKKPHGTRNGEPDHDGGYALKHAWI